MSSIQDCYKYWRQIGRKPATALHHAREDVASHKDRYPRSLGGMSGGQSFAAYGERAMMWFENPGDHMRRVGYSDEIVRHIDHNGWYTDDDGALELMRGVVYQLPTRHGKQLFMYGYADPNNDGAACLSLSLADDKEDAARWADDVARIAAEQERDYQRAWQAGVRYNELGEEITEARRSCLTLIREAKAACERLTDLPTIKATIRLRVECYLDSIREAREEREKLKDDFGREPGFNDV